MTGSQDDVFARAQPAQAAMLTVKLRATVMRKREMSGLSQVAFAEVLERAWEHVQQVREETGVVVELRLTAVGLTALAVDMPCNRIGTVSWLDLAQSRDLRGLLCARITEVARKQRTAPAILAVAA
jgi:hypothetical protein